MFFLIQQYQAARFSASELQNPQTPGQGMDLVFLRTEMRMAVCTVHSRKAAGEFRDVNTGKVIRRRQWTADMKAFYTLKNNEVPAPPFVFRLTIIGWVALLLIVTFFGVLTFDAVKPPLPKPAASLAMEQKPAVGDIYFGHFEAPQGTGDRLGFGWFRVTKVEGDTYFIAKSTTMSKTSKPKEQLESTSFETEGTPVKIMEQASYLINLKSEDGGMEIYFTDKK